MKIRIFERLTPRFPRALRSFRRTADATGFSGRVRRSDGDNGESNQSILVGFQPAASLVSFCVGFSCLWSYTLVQGATLWRFSKDTRTSIIDSSQSFQTMESKSPKDCADSLTLCMCDSDLCVSVEEVTSISQAAACVEAPRGGHSRPAAPPLIARFTRRLASLSGAPSWALYLSAKHSR